MDEMQEKLGAILNNPQMMQQIQAMAQGFQSNQSASKNDCASPLPDIDFATVQKLSKLASQSHIDKQEQALLRALGAYLTKDRLQKLEKAMKAAKLAKVATAAISMK